jgi:hypothetical protein
VRLKCGWQKLQAIFRSSTALTSGDQPEQTWRPGVVILFCWATMRLRGSFVLPVVISHERCDALPGKFDEAQICLPANDRNQSIQGVCGQDFGLTKHHMRNESSSYGKNNHLSSMNKTSKSFPSLPATVRHRHPQLSLPQTVRETTWKHREGDDG